MVRRQHSEQLCIDGVSYDLSNLLVKTNNTAKTTQHISEGRIHLTARPLNTPLDCSTGHRRTYHKSLSLSSLHSWSSQLILQPDHLKADASSLFSVEGEVSEKITDDGDIVPSIQSVEKSSLKPPPLYSSSSDSSYVRRQSTSPRQPAQELLSYTASSSFSSDSLEHHYPSHEYQNEQPQNDELEYNETQSASDEQDHNKRPITIQIAPGVVERLRGSEETTEAIKRGDITEVQCICCNQFVSYHKDAAYVLCPTCQIVSPALVTHGVSWGVGLGFINP